MQDYEPSELIIDKACALWVKMLSDPKFDALGNEGHSADPNGSIRSAQILGKLLANKNAATVEDLQRFAGVLKKYLLNKCLYDRDNKKMIIDDNGFYHISLGVDYGPDAILATAATESGISEAIFPWKTNMFIRSDHIGLSYGYGGDYVYYYPFDNKWLVTTLCGSDIQKVIEYVKGEKPEFAVEE